MNNKIATLIRIDEEVKNAIEDIAVIEKRSFNKMVEYILQEYVFKYNQELLEEKNSPEN